MTAGKAVDAMQQPSATARTRQMSLRGQEMTLLLDRGEGA